MLDQPVQYYQPLYNQHNLVRALEQTASVKLLIKLKVSHNKCYKCKFKELKLQKSNTEVQLAAYNEWKSE